MLYKGHQNYENLIAEKPVEEMRENIMASIPNYAKSADISYTIKNSIIAIEDHRFYTNSGIDFISLTRAIISTLVHKNVQGASTITMQLSKNYYYEDLSADIIRKFSEVYFAYSIESHYTKEEILEMYLNVIYYGDGYYGINDACLGYFGKQPLMVDYGRATLLAGIINAPSAYQLSSGGAKALQRQIRVINSLYTYNYISQEEKDELLRVNGEYTEIYGEQ